MLGLVRGGGKEVGPLTFNTSSAAPSRRRRATKLADKVNSSGPTRQRGELLPSLARRPCGVWPVSPSAGDTEAIWVAVGGVVLGDDGRGVEEECAEVVDAAAHPEAVRAAVIRVAAAGPVVGDPRSADDHGAGRDVDAAAEAV